MGEQVRGDGLVAALKRVGGVVVAAADVRVHHEVGRLALERRVVEGHAQLGDLLDVRVLHAGLGHEVTVAVDAPGAVVELDVATAGGIEVGQDGTIGRGDVGDELLVGRVDGAEALDLAVATVEDDLGIGLDGRGDGLAGDLPVLLEGLYELEVLDEGVVLAGDLARHDGRVGGGLLVVEHIALAGRAALDALEPPHKVEVPVAAAELAVGDHVEACGLLLGHEVADGLVLDGLEGGRVDDAGREVGAGLLEDVRAQEAADDVVAEGCVVGVRHFGFLSVGLVDVNQFDGSPFHKELSMLYT